MTPQSCRLAVKVVPGARTNGIAGWLGDALRVRVSAPAEKGKANAAVCALIAQVLDLPVAAVTIVRGPLSPHKLIEIGGLDEATVRQRLSDA